MKRFARDSGILIVFCGAFYLLTLIVGRQDAGLNESEFSPARKRADALYQERKWAAASVQFKRLIEQDPYNGRAWNNYSNCLFEMRREVLHELETEQDRESPRTTELLKKVKTADDKVLEGLRRTREFARYRASALLRLAVIETYRGNHDLAMDCLEEYLEGGNVTRHGLWRYREFGTGGGYNAPPRRVRTGLHAEPRFWELVEIEVGIFERY